MPGFTNSPFVPPFGLPPQFGQQGAQPGAPVPGAQAAPPPPMAGGMPGTGGDALGGLAALQQRLGATQGFSQQSQPPDRTEALRQAILSQLSGGGIR